MDVNCPAVGNGRLCMEGVGAVHAIFLYLSPVATPCSELCNQNYLSVKSQGGMTLSSQQRWHLGMTNYRYKAIIGGFSELLNRFIITRQLTN